MEVVEVVFNEFSGMFCCFLVHFWVLILLYQSGFIRIHVLVYGGIVGMVGCVKHYDYSVIIWERKLSQAGDYSECLWFAYPQ
ncbi:hypothetical protein ABID39_001576 [Bartonella japonica]|uniref:Uncharacterized protein n=1 Tax=Bartonella japonica TaxID=357761 RepID=A0ABV2FQL7_9HYPH